MKQMSITVLLMASLAMVSCKKDEPEDPIIPNEEEVITTLSLTLTPTDDGSTVILLFQDIDGDGGFAPNIEGGTLMAQSEYTGTMELLNELEDPDLDITAEVEDEAEEHQFFYSSTINDLLIEYTDEDANANPIGLTTRLTTGEPGSGTLSVVLKHEPDKGAEGVSDGVIDNAGGETDIEVSFDIRVE